MLALAVLAAAASAPQLSTAPTGPVVQAMATVRIISGVQLRLDGQANGVEIPAPRNAVIQANGTDQPARLIEFQ
jgi:hypothetical protein